MSADGSVRVRLGRMASASAGMLPARRRLILWSGAGGLALAALAAWIVYVRSPGYVVDATIRALNRRDVQGLLALASDHEKRTLNLTPSTVSAFLRETWWREPHVHPRIRFTLVRRYYADQLAYVGEVRGFAPRGRPQVMLVEVYRDKSRGWRLALSRLLWVSCPICWNLDEQGDYSDGLAALLRRTGIHAAVSMDGTARYPNGLRGPKIPLCGR